MQNAMMLCPKIVGAEGGVLYIIGMENASIIRTNARELEVRLKAHCYLTMQGSRFYYSYRRNFKI